MLVLARKPSEAIKIGDDILVKVIAIRGGQVKLGIEAPQGVRVIRTDATRPEPPGSTLPPEQRNSNTSTTASERKVTED